MPEQESDQRSRPGRGVTCKMQELLSACHRQATAFDSLRGAPPRPGPHSRRYDHRPLKMFRFSADSTEQACRFAICKRSKIGTFLNAGRRCGWGYLRGAHLSVAPLRSASFGTFLAETRKVRRGCRIDKFQFIGPPPQKHGTVRCSVPLPPRRLPGATGPPRQTASLASELLPRCRRSCKP